MTYQSPVEKAKRRGFQDQSTITKKRKEALQEREKQKKEQWNKGLENIQTELFEIYNKYKNNLPLTEEVRINNQDPFFDSVRAPRHKKKQEVKERSFNQKNNIERRGEQLEMLKTVLFDRFIGEDFYVLRSSKYDDYHNGVDNILINKKTGDVVCAFDEVATLSESITDTNKEKKEKFIKDRIRRNGGAKINYGFKIDKERHIEPVILEGVPLFLISLNERLVETAIKIFGLPEAEESEEKKRKIFDYIIQKLKNQAEKFDNIPRHEIKRNYSQWKQSLRNFIEYINLIDKE